MHVIKSKAENESISPPCFCLYYTTFSFSDFSFSLCRNHSGYSLCPSLLSKKAWISERKHLARASSSCFGISLCFADIRHHSCLLLFRLPPYILISKPPLWFSSGSSLRLFLRSLIYLFFLFDWLS